MKIDIVTLFPDFFKPFIETSIVKRAIDKKLVTIDIHYLRDYSKRKHQQVDDTIYGGGAGMLLALPPLYEAIENLKTDDSYIILLSPQGRIFNQQIATHLSSEKKHIILICGHYEGVDARLLEFIDEEMSIGDYVLTGGEIPAMIIADSVTRLISGVITEASYLEDTHQQGLLKYPQYTKPETFKGRDVPSILLSGHHEKIRIWRLEESLKKTYLKRPDLIDQKTLSKEEAKILQKIKKEIETK